MLGDAQRDLHYIMIFVYILIGEIDATAGIGISDVHGHTDGDGTIRNS